MTEVLTLLSANLDFMGQKTTIEPVSKLEAF